MLVILDRDGVINAYEEGQYIGHQDQWQPLPGSIEAISRLCRAGYTVAVATNQSGIARGYFSQGLVNDIHDRLQAMVAEAGGSISYFAVCPHHPDENCHCRKPEAGLLLEIQQHFGLPDLADSWMVGDNRTDLEAALTAGSKPVLVRTGSGTATLAHLDDKLRARVIVADDLSAFVDELLQEADG